MCEFLLYLSRCGLAGFGTRRTFNLAFFHICTSWLGLISQDTVDWIGWATDVISHSSGGWKSVIKVPAHVVLGGVCLVCSGREDERFLHSSCKGTNLIHEGPALVASWPSNAVPLNWRLDSNVLFWGGTQTCGSWHGSSPSVHPFTSTPQLRKVTTSPHSHQHSLLRDAVTPAWMLGMEWHLLVVTCVSWVTWCSLLGYLM